MRISIFLSAVIFIAFSYTGYGQTEKGKFFMAGGSAFSFSSGTSESNDNQGNSGSNDLLSITLTPQVGYFLANNFVAGIQIPYSYTKSENQAASFSTSSFLIGPFLRYYFSTSVPILKPYLNTAVSFGNTKDKTEIPFLLVDDESTSRLTSIQLGAGLAIFLSENVSIDFILEYNYASDRPEEDTEIELTTDSFRAGIGIGVFF